ncbi:MAG: hypothetical protein KDD85_00635 [Parvularculaceae bacterium]|nr:hypothetical protein [Parvularculaceae bacterium]
MKKTIARISLGALALALSAGAANAQGQDLISNPRGMVANFDAVNLGPVLTELGIVWQERRLADGQSFIAASIGGALNFVITPTTCLSEDRKSNCVGAHFIALFGGGSANAQSVSAFNQKYGFTSAGIFSGGSSAFLSRYDIADYGIPRGNVASSINAFFSLSEKFRRAIDTKTVSADGYADDMSASILNLRSADAAGIELAQGKAPSLAELHQASFESGPALVRELLQSDNAPRNKISNLTQ